MNWCFNRRVSSMSQSSLFIIPDTLVLWRWSFSVNLAAFLWIKGVNAILCVWIPSANVSFQMSRLEAYTLDGGRMSGVPRRFACMRVRSCPEMDRVTETCLSYAKVAR